MNEIWNASNNNNNNNYDDGDDMKWTVKMVYTRIKICIICIYTPSIKQDVAASS